MALEGIVQVIVFPDKVTVWVLTLTYNENGVLVDPTSVKVSITDPDDTVKVDEAAMTKYNGNTGIYEYFYHKGESADPMDEGQWRGEVITIDGTSPNDVVSSQNFAFEVK